MERERQRDRDEPDRHVEPEDPRPIGLADERAADDRAETDGDAADSPPKALGETAALVEERVAEDGERQRDDHPRADTLRGPRNVEQLDVRRKRARGRRSREDRQPEQEDPPLPEAVAQRSSGQ